MSAPLTDPTPSPLHAEHERLGAHFTDFGGWLMPLRYARELEEHRAVREAAGLFDLSHMAEFRVTGPDAGAFLDYALAGALSATQLGQAKYSLVLAEDGGIIDDLVVYRLGDTDYLLVANAGNHDPVAAELEARRAGFDVLVTDETAATALIAVQGPASETIVAEVLVARFGADADAAVRGLKYYRAVTLGAGPAAILVARTGYTGEDGFELYLPVAGAGALWREIEQAGAAHGLVPAGLACRDTLRLEAGMPLYGNEVGLDTLPVQLGLGRVVALSKPGDFVGRAAIEAAGDGARLPVLVGLLGEGRRAGRGGYTVLAGENVVGVVTSGALSPTLGVPIQIARVSPEYAAAGTELAIDVRGTAVPARVVSLPFYRREKSK